MSPSLVLIGPRGAGKSRLGALAAIRLGVPFIDLDDLVTARFGGVSVSDIWRRFGEPAFREAEADALGQVLDGTPPRVVALGGGTPTVPRARELLERARARGAVVVALLLAPPALLAERIRADASGARPSLTGADPADEIAAVLDSRRSLYRSLADLELDTTAPEPECVDALLAALAQRTARPHGAG